MKESKFLPEWDVLHYFVVVVVVAVPKMRNLSV